MRLIQSTSSRGFTLIEASLAIVIVGTGILATFQLFAACTQQNRFGMQMTTAMFLATNVQEALAELPFNDPLTGRATFGAETGETLATFDDVDDFNALSCSPPIDSMRDDIAEMSQYTQTITVTQVDPNRPSLAAVGTDAVRVVVQVLYRADESQPIAEVYRSTWIRMRN